MEPSKQLKIKSFTLIEMAVSLLVFAVAIGIASVSYINLLKANIAAQNTYAALENLRLAMEKIWREIKYSSNVSVSPGPPVQISFKLPRENCQTATIALNTNTKILTYQKGSGVADNLNDPALVSIESFQITNSASPVVFTFSLLAQAKAPGSKVPVPLNAQMSVAPLNAAFPTEPCQ